MSGTAEADWGSTTPFARRWPGTFTDVTSQTLGLGETSSDGQLHRILLPAKPKSWATTATTATTGATELVERAVNVWASAERSRVLALFPRYTANVSLSEPTRDRDQLSVIELFFLVGASRISKATYAAVLAGFTDLIDRLRDDDDIPELKRDSLKYALRFLELACPKKAPSFSVTSAGDFYLQWYDKPTASIAGITFRSNGQAIWSASGQSLNNPIVRDAAAGTTSTDDLRDKLRPHAEWIF